MLGCIWWVASRIGLYVLIPYAEWVPIFILKNTLSNKWNKLLVPLQLSSENKIIY